MPESLFANRPLRRGRLAVMAVGSLVFHACLVGVAALVPTGKSYELPTPVTDVTLDDKPYEEVQQLIVKDEPTPPPEATPEPTPPMDETPLPDTPPPTEEPDMADVTPTPPPKPKVHYATTPPPANAKRGPVAQPGQVNGNVAHSTNLTGNPGGHGWHTPRPPYPYQARAAHTQGSGSVRVSTDGSGHVISASIAQSVGNGILDANTVSFAKSNWSGPPNQTTTVPITYVLQ